MVELGVSNKDEEQKILYKKYEVSTLTHKMSSLTHKMSSHKSSSSTFSKDDILWVPS